MRSRSVGVVFNFQGCPWVCHTIPPSTPARPQNTLLLVWIVLHRDVAIPSIHSFPVGSPFSYCFGVFHPSSPTMLRACSASASAASAFTREENPMLKSNFLPYCEVM